MRDTELLIPATNLDACQGLTQSHNPRMLFGNLASLQEPALGVEKGRLEALGVSLD